MVKLDAGVMKMAGSPPTADGDNAVIGSDIPCSICTWREEVTAQYGTVVERAVLSVTEPNFSTSQAYKRLKVSDQDMMIGAVSWMRGNPAVPV